VLSLVAALVVAAVAAAGPASPQRRPAGDPRQRPNADVERAFADAAPPLDLPAATAPPAPAPPQIAAATLAPHEIFGFAPWWNLADEQAFDVKDLTTLAYFSLDVNPDGSIDESNSGWDGYQSQALADLISRAHAADDRVVLTVTCFDQGSLDKLTSDPSAPARLGSTLVQLVSAKNLDGVDFDFEGNGPRDRRGLDDLIASVSSQLRAADPHWQITMSTYGSSAGDPSGFFDIAGLAPSVDAFFVMAYDMNEPSTPSPTAPLTGPGNEDAVDLAEYAAVVPRSKIILGVPYYGYEWPTSGPDLGASATGPATPVTYAQVAAQDLPSYWDQTSQTPWTAFQSADQWYQIFFDDPTSVALKARLANEDRILGVGVWALGMDGNDPAMVAALLGNAAPDKYLSGPASGAPASGAATPTATPSYTYRGVWNGVTETLAPVHGSLPGGGQARSAGSLSSFSTNDPSAACLSSGPPLPVYQLVASPTTYVVQATTPGYCASGTWQFTSPGAPGGGSSPTTTTTTTPGRAPGGSTPLTIPVLTPTSAPSSTSTSAPAGPSASTSSTEPKGLLGL
jgi:hypothetical protein